MALIREIEQAKDAIRRQHADHHSSAPIIRATELTVGYESGFALDNVSFELARAVRLGVLGPNGAGKSTLLKVIAGVLQPSAGKVEIFGEAPGEHICIAYVPQRSQVDWNFPVSVRDVVMMGRIGKLGLMRRASKTDWQAVDTALDTVNLLPLARRQISELSGGQQQRMFIARALAQEAELMLMDEPLTGLDVRSQEEVLGILESLREQRVTVLVALHDLKMAAEHFEAVMLLNRHLVGLGSPQDVFTTERLIDAYGSHRVTGTIGSNAASVGRDDRTEWVQIDDDCCGNEGHSHD